MEKQLGWVQTVKQFRNIHKIPIINKGNINEMIYNYLYYLMVIYSKLIQFLKQLKLVKWCYY
jgi:hypothetical protein